MGGGLTKGTWCFPVLPSLEWVTEVSQFSFSPFVPGAFQAATPPMKLRGSESSYWFSKIDPVSHSHSSFLDIIPIGFHSQSYGDSYSQCWGPGVGMWPFTPQWAGEGGAPQPDIPPDSNCHTVGVGPPVPPFRPSYQSQRGFVFISLVIGILIR